MFVQLSLLPIWLDKERNLHAGRSIEGLPSPGVVATALETSLAEFSRGHKRAMPSRSAATASQLSILRLPKSMLR